MEPRTAPRSPLALEDYLVLAAVLLLPWAFGGVELPVHRAAALLLAGSAAVVLWKRGWEGLGLGRREALWLLPALLLALWGALQLVPLPAGVLRAVSPQAYEVYTVAFPGYPGGTGRLGLAAVERQALERVPEAQPHALPAEPSSMFPAELPACFARTWLPLSLQPSATQERLFWYVALLLGFLVVRQQVSDRRVFPWFLAALLVNFTLLAIFGLVQDWTWNDKLFWVRRLDIVAEPFGPYVNPVHFSSIMELALPAFLGYIVSRVARVGRSAIYEARVGGAAVAAAICLVAAVAAASKVATVLIALSLLALVLLIARTLRGRLIVLVAGLVILVAAGAVLSETRLAQRVEDFILAEEEGAPMEGRVSAWRGAYAMFQDYKVTGTGFGTFRQVFPRYLLTGASREWEQLHSDYMELLLDGGLVALLLVIWLAWGYGSRVLRRARRIDDETRAGNWGLVMGVAALALHAAVDFNHQMPGTALLFVAFCALALPAEGPIQEQASRRVPRTLLVVGLVGVFAYRAGMGIAAGWTLDAERPLDVGFDRLDALLTAAQRSVSDWDAAVDRGGPGSADPKYLRAAAESYLRCRCVAPAAMWSWRGHGKVYDEVERREREARSLEPLNPVHSPWERVGYPGRVAVGMMRRALDAGPNWYVVHDRLALTLWSYRLDDEARESVKDSARACPPYGRHRYSRVAELPPWVLDEFALASREALGSASFLTKSQHLIELAKLGMQQGNWEQAIADLQQALTGRLDRVHRAEAVFHLGLALASVGRDVEAREQFAISAEHPAFRPSALINLARSHEALGEDEQAFAHLRSLRREEPENGEYCLWFSRVARRLGDWPAAREALAWAQVLAPEDPAPIVALVETYIAMGDLSSARQELAELEQHAEAAAETERLERELERAMAGRAGA